MGSYSSAPDIVSQETGGLQVSEGSRVGGTKQEDAGFRKLWGI